MGSLPPEAVVEHVPQSGAWVKNIYFYQQLQREILRVLEPKSQKCAEVAVPFQCDCNNCMQMSH